MVRWCASCSVRLKQIRQFKFSTEDTLLEAQQYSDVVTLPS